MKKNIKKETRGRKRGKFYVSNDELVVEIRRYYDEGVFSEELGKHAKKVVDGVSHMPNFINYFKEDNPWGTEMYSDAIWRITKSVYDKNCKVIDDELIGTTETDCDGNIIYELDSEGEFVIDDDGNKVEKKIKQNNVFSYFTRTASNAFIGRIKKEQKITKDLNDYRDDIFNEYESEYGIKHQQEGEYKDESDW